MANISQIKLPDDTAYNLKDKSGSLSSHLHHDEDLVPIMSKTYASTSYYATSNDYANASWYFMSVVPDAWYKPWRVKFKVRTTCPNAPNWYSYTWSTICGRTNGITYANWNEQSSTAHTYIVCYPLKSAGFDAGYGHAIGISIYNGNSPTASNRYRTFDLDYYDCENCTVTILDTPVKWTDWTGTGTTNYDNMSSLDANSRGLQESGDSNTYDAILVYFGAKTGAQGIWAGSLFMQDGNGTYQNICTASDGTATSGNRTAANTKLANANGFLVGGTIYYSSGSYDANSNISGWGHVRSRQAALFDARYAFNVTLTANSLTPYAPVYLVGTINSTNGLFYLDQVWWTQTPNATDKIYILVGGVYDSTTSNCRMVLYENNPWYRYDGTKLVELTNGHIVNADVPSDAKFTDTQADWNETDDTSAAFIKNKPSTMPPSSHTHGNIQNGGILQTSDITVANGDKLVVTDASDSNKIARTSVAFDGSTATKALTKKGTFEDFAPATHTQSADTITYGYLNTHPENQPVIIPFINNDIAYLSKRGGSAIIKFDGVEQPSVSLNSIFDASPSYLSLDSRDKNEVVIEMTLHKAFTWTSIVYIDFGANNWRAKSVKFEVMNSDYEGDTWTQKYSTTTNAVGHCYVNISHQPTGASSTGAGFNKLRVTLSDWQTSSSSGLRIAQIGIYNYNSASLRETFLPKDGGEMYNATVNPATNDTGNIGTSAKKWANGYFTNINGVTVTNSPKFTDTTYAVGQGDNDGQIKVTPSSGSAYNVSVKGLNNSAYKDYTTSVTSGSADLVTSGAVYTAIADLPEPMIFKGTLGTGGTITSLPTASASNEGFTYKVITDGTYASQSAEVGDVFVSAKPEGASEYTWILIPSGDEDSDTWRNIKVNGTEKLGSAISTGAVDFVNGTGTTANFDATGSKISYNVTYGNSANTACEGNDSRLSDARTPTSHTHGNITNGGALQTNDVAIASGDKLVVTDASNSNKVARTSVAFDGSTTTKALTQKGTWETFSSTDTTYTLDNNGASVRLTPSSGSAQNVSLSTLINGLTEGTASAQGDDYLVAQYAGGGTSNTNYYRRKVSKVVNKTIVDNALGTGSDTTKFYRSDGSWEVPNYPTVNNKTVTIQKNGTTVDSFTLNQSSNKTVNITMDKSDVGLGDVPNVATNDQIPTFTQASSRANIASGEKLSVLFGKIMKWFADLKDLAFIAKDGTSSTKYLRGDGTWQAFPTIPTVNNGTLTIKQNDTSKGTFTANQSGNSTIELTDTTYSFATGSDFGSISVDGTDIPIKMRATTVSSLSDLDNYKTAGAWYFSSSYAHTHMPPNVTNGMLVVYTYGSTGVKQVFYRHGTVNTNDYQTFIRTYNSSTWSDWQRYAIADEVPSYTLSTEDLDDIKTSGFYTGENNNTCTNKPSGINQFGLIVSKSVTSNNKYCTQILFAPTTGAIWKRSDINGTWETWTEVKITDTTYTFASGTNFGELSINGTDQAINLQPTIISGSQTIDLDNYTSSGLFYIRSTVTINNAPESGTYGYLLVMSYSTNIVKQIWFRQTNASSSSKNTFVRTKSTTSGTPSWSSWSRYVMEGDDSCVTQVPFNSTDSKSYHLLLENNGSNTSETDTVKKCNSVYLYTDYMHYGLYCDVSYVRTDQAFFVSPNLTPDVEQGTRYEDKQITYDNSSTIYAVFDWTTHQQMLFAASYETDYKLFFGVDGTGSNAKWTLAPDTSGKLYLGTSNRKWSQIYSTNSTISTSDRNEKKDIVSLDSSAKDFIMALNPVSYKFIEGESGRTHYGMIAQDVEEEMTELGMSPLDFAGFCKDQKMSDYVEDVDGHKQKKQMPIEGEYAYGLRYEEFIAPMIKTIQLQQKEIDDLKSELAEIKALLLNK